MKATKTDWLLLVDDHPDILGMLTLMLSEKYNVMSYGHPEEALLAVQTLKPDLLVLDVAMYPIDGMECLAAIRSLPGYSRIPAVALTAYARPEDRVKFLAAGFQAVVTKPVLDQAELEAVLDRVLKNQLSSATVR